MANEQLTPKELRNIVAETLKDGNGKEGSVTVQVLGYYSINVIQHLDSSGKRQHAKKYDVKNMERLFDWIGSSEAGKYIEIDDLRKFGENQEVRNA